MALGVTYLYKWPLKNTGEFIAIIQVTGDTAYPNTGGTVGYPITAATFQMNTFASQSDYSAYQATPGVPTIDYFQLANVVVSSSGGFTKIDGTTANLRFFGSTGTEITNSSTAAAISVVLMAFGH